MKNLFCFLLILLCLSNLNAQQKKISFSEYDLANGLHVILYEDHTTPIVAVSVMYHVGSKNEDPERTGFAHFFEHLMFSETENISEGQYTKYVQNAGGELNAFTSFDKTYYYQILPSNQLALGLWLEAERMQNLNINEKAVETQRKVVKEERKQRFENEPYGSFLEEMFKRAYTLHPYRWIPIGHVQYIDQATVNEFAEFYQHYYVPQNATLSIAGDIDPAAAKTMIGQYFNDIPRGKTEIKRPQVVEPPQEGERRDIIHDNIQLPGIFIAYHMPAQGTADYYALSMLTTLLSEGQSSRLYKEIVDEQQKAVQVTAIPLAFEDPGLFVVLAIANLGIESAEVETLMEKEFEKVKTDLISEREFKKLQNQVESRFIEQISTVAGIAQSLADYHIFFKDTNLINTEITHFQKVTREDIKRVANQYLIKSNRVVLTYLPKTSG
jgi:predicted Zn-dependent peptidase